MSSQACFYCGHLLPRGSSGETCPNCGAPTAAQSSLPTLPFAPKQAQTASWRLTAASLPSEAPADTRRTAGLLGSRAGFDTALAPSAAVPQPSSDDPGLAASNHPASLEGRVDTPPTRTSIDVPLEWWSQGVLRLCFPPLFYALAHRLLVIHPETNKSEQKQVKSTMAVLTMRVRREDQSLGEARLEGDVTEGEPSLGDRVALYGEYRGNTLIVKEGYNLSFQPGARIKIRPPLPLTRTRIAVIVLGALLLLLFGLFLSFLPLFSYHAGSGHSLVEAAQYLKQHNLLPGGVFAALAVMLFSISGALIRCLIAVLVAIALLAVYSALGGAGLPPLPIHL